MSKAPWIIEIDAYREIESLAETIRKYGNGPAGLSALDEILVKSRAYMEPDQELPFPDIQTTPSRKRMLALLMKRRGQAVSRSSLMDVCVSRDEFVSDSRIVDVHICLLRRALIGTEYENMIETVWGQGFRFKNVQAISRIAA